VGGALLVAGAIVIRTGEAALNRLGGLGRRMPLTFAAFAVAAFAISGVPDFSGFVSKGLVTKAAESAAGDIVRWALVVGGVGTALSFARFGYYAFVRPAPGPVTVRPASRALARALVALAVPSVVFGLVPAAFFGWFPGDPGSFEAYAGTELAKAGLVTGVGVVAFVVLRGPLGRFHPGDFDRALHPAAARLGRDSPSTPGRQPPGSPRVRPTDSPRSSVRCRTGTNHTFTRRCWRSRRRPGARCCTPPSREHQRSIMFDNATTEPNYDRLVEYLHDRFGGDLRLVASFDTDRYDYTVRYVRKELSTELSSHGLDVPVHRSIALFRRPYVEEVYAHLGSDRTLVVEHDRATAVHIYPSETEGLTTKLRAGNEVAIPSFPEGCLTALY
jgi:hypothetical protein